MTPRAAGRFGARRLPGRMDSTLSGDKCKDVPGTGVNRVSRRRTEAILTLRRGAANIGSGALRRHAEDDVELGRQLADLRLLDRREIDRHGLAGLRVADAAVDAVPLVARVALD